MCAENYRVVCAKTTDQVAYFNDLLGVKTNSGLVEDDYGRISNKRLSNTDSLTITLGKVTDKSVAMLVDLNNGANLESVKQLLGHESIATTEIYTHTTFVELKKEYDKAHPRA
jgi:hypothetical protein